MQKLSILFTIGLLSCAGSVGQNTYEKEGTDTPNNPVKEGGIPFISPAFGDESIYQELQCITEEITSFNYTLDPVTGNPVGAGHQVAFYYAEGFVEEVDPKRPPVVIGSICGTDLECAFGDTWRPLEGWVPCERFTEVAKQSLIGRQEDCRLVSGIALSTSKIRIYGCGSLTPYSVNEKKLHVRARKVYVKIYGL